MAESPKETVPDGAPKSHSNAGNALTVSQEIRLTRQEVVDILAAAVLTNADSLARFGEKRLRSLALDARVVNGAVEIAGVVAVVEAQLDPRLVAALGEPAAEKPVDG